MVKKMFKNKLFNLTLIILIAITLLGLASFSVYWFYLKSGSNHAQAATTQKSIDEILKVSTETKEITTNLYSGGYLRVEFNIEADSKDAKDELDKRMFQVEHIIIKTLSSMTADDVKGPQGISKMESGIKNQINDILQSGKVVNVITTKLMIQ
jgi:flagellar protein FliL